jgi:hypothetical protein
MVRSAGKLLVRRGWKAEYTLVKVQRRIKGSWVGHLRQRGAKVRIVTGLDCKDGAGNCQIVGIRGETPTPSRIAASPTNDFGSV